MKNLLLMAIGALLLVSFNAWAQHGNGADQCTFGVVVEDLTCNGATNCASTSFWVPCTKSNYCLTCRDLPSPGTSNCKVTATLTKTASGTVVATCFTWDQDGCWGEPGTQVCYIGLSADEEYTLTVCFDACTGSCLSCANFKGWARLSHD
jgi:hypothetical protein